MTLIDMAEAAKRLGTTRDAIRRALRAGDVPLKQYGRTYTVEIDDFERYVESRGGPQAFKAGRPFKAAKETSDGHS